MNNQKFKWQSDVKINHEYELLISQELEQILTQFETNKGIIEAQESKNSKEADSLSNNQGNKRKSKISFKDSDSPRPAKKNHHNCTTLKDQQKLIDTKIVTILHLLLNKQTNDLSLFKFPTCSLTRQLTYVSQLLCVRHVPTSSQMTRIACDIN